MILFLFSQMGWSLFPIRSLMGQFWPTKFQIEPLQNSSPNRHWTQPLWVFECLRKCDSHEFRLIPTHSTHISAQTFFFPSTAYNFQGVGEKKKRRILISFVVIWIRWLLITRGKKKDNWPEWKGESVLVSGGRIQKLSQLVIDAAIMVSVKRRRWK